MNAFFKTFATATAAATLAMATPASAQLTLYEDYEPAEEVVEITMVKVDEGQFETYLEGLKSTWIAANDVSKELGYITDYGIYSVPYGEGEWNMMLVTVYPSSEMLAPNKERYMKFLETYGKANIDAGNQTVLELYNKIRTIQGTYMLSEVKMLK
ncbi:MAG: hypothetical protein QNI87_10280 [Erythrobacter sp.]|uniref:hypothetical protein n=1 Tax=Erythrobacter sp. TaxID=1042 RepID=UPI00262FF933|nr:hypothetical protein [Erythrobacter sp.]MDJ0978912.1 hypothetical protein [Erythrobacter sp.]